MTKRLIYSIIGVLLLLLVFSIKDAYASCNPAQCGVPNVNDCDPNTQMCLAQCCVKKNQGGGTCTINAECPSGQCCGGGACSAANCGGGYTYPTCTTGHLVCNDPPNYFCSYKGGCGSLFPSSWGVDFCDPDKPAKMLCTTNCTCEPDCTPSSPGGPTPLSPAVNSSQSSTTVALQWSSVDFGTKCPQPNYNSYWVYVKQCSASGPIDTSFVAGDLVGTPITDPPGSPTTSLTITRSAGTYCWKVDSGNGQGSGFGQASRFTITGNIEGHVYNDVDGTCSTATPFANAGTVTWGSQTVNVGADGAFSIDPGTDGGSHSLTLSQPPNYVCTPSPCNSDGCFDKPSITAPSTGRNYYLTQARDAWWQVAGAGIYAGAPSGESVRSRLPTPLTRLITTDGSTSTGALIKVSTTAPTLGSGTQISDTNWSARSTYHGTKTDYDFFKGKIGVPSIASNTVGWGGGDTINKLSYDPSREYEYFMPTSGTATIANPWSLSGGEKHLVFINGNLNIANNISVPPSGEFLAFIVHGTITVQPTVTSIAGLFVADQAIAFPGSGGADSQLTVQGSVVSWDRINLSRNLGTAGNLSQPAEKFVYRPDLLANMPLNMKTFVLNWQEVAPGTFGN